VVAFFVLLAGLLSLLFSLLEPFLRSFLWATILVMVFYPIYSRLQRWTGGRNNLAAALATFLVLGFLVLPGFFIATNLGKEIPKAYAYLTPGQVEQRAQWFLERLESLKPPDSWFANWGVDSAQLEATLQKEIAGTLQAASKFVLEKVTGIFKNLAMLILQAAFTSVALFFFFRDGSRLSLRLVELLPLEAVHRDQVVRTLSVTVTAVVRAIFINALVQGMMAGVGFTVAGVPFPILLAVLTFVASFIPFLGAASIWIPAVIWLFWQDQAAAAAMLLAWGVLISTVDNFIKPWLIGQEAKLPIFWLFFTTIGGLKVYGFLGIFLGPIILSMGMAFLAIYREVYLPSKLVRRRKA
jgi:predicted PurR-regulated permease PerM